MTSVRRFHPNDLFRINNINLDVLTETYNMQFYMQYLAMWPAYFTVGEAPGKRLASYIMGKAEGEGDQWHGHVTALTVAPEFRRLGMAQLLMDSLESITENVYNGYFNDLYVRISNNVAVNMYKKFGYVIYRQVMDYYAGEEDAYDMRKACRRDPEKKSEMPLNPLRVPPGPND